MAGKRHTDEDVLPLLRDIELKPAGGDDVAMVCGIIGISYPTYDNERKLFGEMGRYRWSEPMP
jgi:hypothetical protein